MQRKQLKQCMGEFFTKDHKKPFYFNFVLIFDKLFSPLSLLPLCAALVLKQFTLHLCEIIIKLLYFNIMIDIVGTSCPRLNVTLKCHCNISY